MLEALQDWTNKTDSHFKSHFASTIYHPDITVSLHFFVPIWKLADPHNLAGVRQEYRR